MASSAASSFSTLEHVRQPGHPVLVRCPARLSLDDACAWLASAAPALRSGLDEHGSLYLRGLPVATTQDFARVRDVLLHERAQYQEKATPRSSFGNDVFSSTDLPAAQPIRLHNENSYTMNFPGILLFCALVPPAVGGATPVADCRAVLRNLPEDLAGRFRAQGWRLNRTYNENISLNWETAFSTSSRQEVERYCASNHISWVWREDGTLSTSQQRSAVITHPRTGEESWFNHVAFWNEHALDPDVHEVLVDEFGPSGLPFNTTFGDGTPLSAADFAALDAAYRAAFTRETWQLGDILVVDNILAAHGREPFEGERRIAVAMGEPTDLADCRPARPIATFAS
ncbi:TauD/TfdA family dioxygenase [Kineosporia mesophila]|uniref:TauD/TfdA family dioxygenase n=1 Tax=Kineosporia mesophila TaxID=566012 RepID=A0ABP6ZA06_9ACTN|nr:TauD/TfdA family dioxygenase [Kineosporia mesophila]MCD5352123.1 TauD/TfdA family dioxygenase [Kineosporia mesophila]